MLQENPVLIFQLQRAIEDLPIVLGMIMKVKMAGFRSAKPVKLALANMTQFATLVIMLLLADCILCRSLKFRFISAPNAVHFGYSSKEPIYYLFMTEIKRN